MLDDGLEKRIHITVANVRVFACVTFQSGCVNNRKIQLFIGRAEAIEKIKSLVNDPIRTGAIAIDFIDNNHGHETLGKGLFRDEASLRHRTFDGVDQQQHAIHHGQDAFNLTTEIGVSRCIHDIDEVVVPFDRRILRQNCDATFPFKIV